MGAKISPEMIKARLMIEKGATAYRAAKDCDVTVSAITRSQWYKDFKKAESEAQTEPPIDSMRKARLLIEDEGKTAYEAAKLTGVAQSSISRSAWYRAHVEKLEGDSRK